MPGKRRRPKGDRIHIRVDAATKSRWEVLAERDGRTLTSWIIKAAKDLESASAPLEAKSSGKRPSTS